MTDEGCNYQRYIGSLPPLASVWVNIGRRKAEGIKCHVKISTQTQVSNDRPIHILLNMEKVFDLIFTKTSELNFNYQYKSLVAVKNI